MNLTHRDIITTLGGIRRRSVSSSATTRRTSSLLGLKHEDEGKEEEEEEDDDDVDILVLLDAFKAVLHTSLVKTVPRWRPTLTPFIRQTVRDAVWNSRTPYEDPNNVNDDTYNRSNSSNNNNNDIDIDRRRSQTGKLSYESRPLYAAVHIRGGDGPFKSTINERIQQVFYDITSVIEQWLKDDGVVDHHMSDRLVRTVTTTTTTKAMSTTTNVTTPIGLYIATDINNIHQHKVFQSEAMNLTDFLYEEYQLNLTIFFQKDTLRDATTTTTMAKSRMTTRPTNIAVRKKKDDTGTRQEEEEPTATSLLGGMLYGDIFWDIQVCVCATIGFVGSHRSTFSNLIRSHRLGDDPC